MKKNYIMLLSIATSIYPVSYIDLQDKLKDELCYGQQILKDHQDYKQFLEECLFEMERMGMEVPIACTQRADVTEALSYFKILPVLNIAIFLNYFTEPTPYAQYAFIKLQDKMLAAIQKIKFAWKLDDLDAEYELQQVIDLLYTSQLIYYMVMYDDIAMLVDLFSQDDFLQNAVKNLC